MIADWKVRPEGEESTLEDRTVSRLRSLIESGDIAPGAQLMAEPELATTLGVSRPTLRAAIAILAADKLLVRRRGIGTFVASQAASFYNGFERLRGTAESLLLNGQAPGVTGLDVAHTAADPTVADRMKIREGSLVVRIRRTFTADGSAVMFAEEWIPEEFLKPTTSLDDFTAEDSLYQRLTKLGLTINHVTARFVPMNADRYIAEHLATSRGRPILLLEQSHYTDSVQDRVVLFSNNYHEPERIDIQIVRRG